MDCHLVPRFYIAQFADPTVQAGGKKRVWKYRFDLAKWRAVSPRSVASQIDYYVAVDASGARDERIEREVIAPLEDAAAKLLRSKLVFGATLSDSERSTLAAFVALMFLRTRYGHEVIGESVSEISEVALLMAASIAESDPKSQQIRNLLKTHKIRVAPQYPMVLSLSLLGEIAAGIDAMGWTLVSAPLGEYFVTSDDPYRQVNPDSDPPSAFGGLGQLNVEVSLPLSRSVAFFAGWHSKGYRWVVAPPGFVEEINRRTLMTASIIISPKPVVPGFEQILKDWELRKPHLIRRPRVNLRSI